MLCSLYLLKRGMKLQIVIICNYNGLNGQTGSWDTHQNIPLSLMSAYLPLYYLIDHHLSR